MLLSGISVTTPSLNSEQSSAAVSLNVKTVRRCESTAKSSEGRLVHMFSLCETTNTRIPVSRDGSVFEFVRYANKSNLSDRGILFTDATTRVCYIYLTTTSQYAFFCVQSLYSLFSTSTISSLRSARMIYVECKRFIYVFL